MSGFYTVITKQKMLDCINGNLSNKDINNLSDSPYLGGLLRKCCEICCIETDEIAKSSPFLPSIYVENDELDEDVISELEGVFPINWQDHIVLKVNPKNLVCLTVPIRALQRFFTVSNFEGLDSETINLELVSLASKMVEDCEWESCAEEDKVQFLLDFKLDNLEGYLILDDAFGMTEDTETKDAVSNTSFNTDVKGITKVLESTAFKKD